MMDPLSAFMKSGLDNPKSSQSLSLLVKNMLANNSPSPEVITLPDAFMRKAGLAISQTNSDGRERGFTLLANDQNQLMLPDEKRWSIGNSTSVLVKPFNEPGIKDIGVFHTHPYQEAHGAKAALAFSQTDVITFLKCGMERISILGAPDGSFLMMYKTPKTPLAFTDPISILLGNSASIDPTIEVNSIYNNAKRQYSGLVGLNWINMAHAQIQQKFGLIFYQSEPRQTRNDPVSSVMLKVDLNDGGFARKK